MAYLWFTEFLLRAIQEQAAELAVTDGILREMEAELEDIEALLDEAERVTG
jgi:hypothetical protein